ncbi:MAG: methyltransferase domain-containing protein [Sphingomonas fennica]
MSLAVRRIAEERMDDPALDPATYAAVLADLARVNRWTLAARPTIAFLDTLAGRGARRLSILDVGFGQGDMLRRIARWGRRRGVELALTGVDLNPRSAAVAAAATPPDMAIDWVTGDYRDLPPADVILSSLVAHHMAEAELIAFLRHMERHARAGWLVNDLHRHAFAYHGWPLLAAAMRWHSIVRHDGRLSIARSFRPADWRRLLAEAGIAGAGVTRHFPFRLCVARIR